MSIFAIVLLVLACPFNVLCQLNMTAYRKMPPIYELDDYDKCLDTQTSSAYCMVIAEIVPNATSSLWKEIARFSKDIRRNYRHDYLLRGICVSSCMELMNSSLVEKDQHDTGEITDTELREYFTDIVHYGSNARDLYGRAINYCLNNNVKNKYGLEVRTFIQYCDTNEPAPRLDFCEIAFLVLIGTLVVLVALSSNYDRQLKNKQPPTMQGNDFYHKPLYTQMDTMLTSFSIYRNCYRLVRQPKSPTVRDFRFFDAFKFFATLLVTGGHVILYLKVIPNANTSYVENFFHRFESHILLNGTVIIEMFFVMSSFFLCFSFQKTMASKKPGLIDWVGACTLRYLRFAPSLAFIIFVHASIFPRLEDGPIWRYNVAAEQELCRKNWWSNLFFINNYMLKTTCLHHTWYLAADFQLYAIFAALLIFIARFPKSRGYILAAGVAISVLVPGLVSYFQGLNGIYQESPETYRYLFWTKAKTLYQGYAPFYMHFGSFFLGTIAALIYIKYKDQGLNLEGTKKKVILNVCFYFTLPLAFSLLLSGYIFMRYEFPKPSIWVGLYAAFHRNIWALMCCCLLLMLCFKVGGMVYTFSSKKIFTPLGRLSFQVYLIHWTGMRLINGYIRQPIYTRGATLTWYIGALIFLSYGIAFIIYMLIETPLNVIINTAAKGSGKPSKGIDQTNGKEKTIIVPTTVVVT